MSIGGFKKVLGKLQQDEGIPAVGSSSQKIGVGAKNGFIKAFFKLFNIIFLNIVNFF